MPPPWAAGAARHCRRSGRAARRRVEAQAKAKAHAARPRRAEAETERERKGQKRRGRAPQPIEETPGDKAQLRGTEAALHIMQTHHTGWDSWGHAQARVDEACQISLACDVSAAPTDKHQAEPRARATWATLAQAGMARPPDEAGEPRAIPSPLGNGDERAAAAQALEDVGIDPSMAAGRQTHHAPEAEASAEPATAQEHRAANGRTPAGKALDARRKGLVEPGCGQSKESRGFRHFLLRGLKKSRGEWSLGCLTPNLLKVWRYGCVQHAVYAGKGALGEECDGVLAGTGPAEGRLRVASTQSVAGLDQNRHAFPRPKRSAVIMLGQPPRQSTDLL